MLWVSILKPIFPSRVWKCPSPRYADVGLDLVSYRGCLDRCLRKLRGEMPGTMTAISRHRCCRSRDPGSHRCSDMIGLLSPMALWAVAFRFSAVKMACRRVASASRLLSCGPCFESAFCGFLQARRAVILQYTKETAHSSCTKEFFQLEANEVHAFRPPKGLIWQLPRD